MAWTYDNPGVTYDETGFTYDGAAVRPVSFSQAGGFLGMLPPKRRRKLKPIVVERPKPVEVSWEEALLLAYLAEDV